MTDTDTRFDDMRPYRDAEIPAAMRRITASEAFPLLASYVYPELTVDEARERLNAFRTIDDFQLDTMRHVNEQVIKRSITQLTFGGLEHIDMGQRYLFVSNHRDIMLDACLLQYILVINGHETTEITFGANLMTHPTVVDVGRSNKMFRVERPGGSLREFYRSSLHLSEYIRHTICERRQSVWIAQRNGRTKDRRDATDPGLVKMFCMSHTADKISALRRPAHRASSNILRVGAMRRAESPRALRVAVLAIHEEARRRPQQHPHRDNADQRPRAYRAERAYNHSRPAASRHTDLCRLP